MHRLAGEGRRDQPTGDRDRDKITIPRRQAAFDLPAAMKKAMPKPVVLPKFWRQFVIRSMTA